VDFVHLQLVPEKKYSQGKNRFRGLLEGEKKWVRGRGYIIFINRPQVAAGRGRRSETDLAKMSGRVPQWTEGVVVFFERGADSFWKRGSNFGGGRRIACETRSVQDSVFHWTVADRAG